MIEHLQADLEHLRKRNNITNIPLVWDEEIRIMLELKKLGCKTVFNGLNIEDQIEERQRLKRLLSNLHKSEFKPL